MKNTFRAAVVAAMLGFVSLGFAGVATAAPLNDPIGLCASHDDAGNCWFAAGGPSVNIDMKFPSNAPREQAIVDYLTKVTNDFNANTQLGTLDNPRPMQELDVTSTNYTSANTQTAVLTVYQNTGGAYPLTWHKAFGYNNVTKAPITFDSLFTPGSKPLDVIVPIVQQQISSQVGQPFTVDPQYGFDPANYQDFAVTNDAVIFFFGKNQLRAATGAFEVSVPRNAIASILTPGI